MFRDREYEARHGVKAHALAEPGFMHRGLYPDDILVTMGGGDARGHSFSILPALACMPDTVQRTEYVLP